MVFGSRSGDADPWFKPGLRAVLGPPTLDNRLVALALLLVPVFVVDLLIWPGHFDDDTLNMIGQMRTGGYTNQWSPVLSWLWHFVYHHTGGTTWQMAGLGPAWSMTAETALLSAGIYLILRAVANRFPAALLTAVIMLLPPVFAQLLGVGRDMWFLSAATFAFGAVVRAGSLSGRRRLAWMVVGLASAWVAQAARQNALSVLIFLLAFMAWQLLPVSTNRFLRIGRLRVVSALAAGLVACGLIFVSQSAMSAAIGVQNTSPNATFYLFDLTALSHKLHRDLIPADIIPKAGAMQKINADYDPTDVSRILVLGVTITPKTYPIVGARYASLRHAWIKMVEDYPGDYAAWRLSEGARVLSIGQTPYLVYQPATGPNVFSYSAASPSRDKIATGYLNVFTHNTFLSGGFFYNTWIYALAATLGAGLLIRWRRRSAAAIPIALFGLSTWGLWLGVTFLAAGVPYRYLDLTEVAGLVTAAAVGLLAWRARGRADDSGGSLAGDDERPGGSEPVPA